MWACVQMLTLDVCCGGRNFTFGPGTITGASDFILRQHRRFRVVARQRTRALQLQRTDFDRLASTLPEVTCASACHRTACLLVCHVEEVHEGQCPGTGQLLC
jgi:hypothetical protein